MPPLVAPPLAVPSAVPPDSPHGGSEDVAVGRQHRGRAHLTARADPGPVEGAYWFVALSWQGGGFVLAHLQPVRDGVWRTDTPVSLTGKWKTMIRLHTPVHTTATAPVYLPADPAVPAKEHPAAGGPRPFVEEKVA